MTPLAPELRLLAQLCASNFRGGEQRAPLLVGSVDWEVLLNLARFHRVQALAFNAIDALGLDPPGQVRADLAGEAERVTSANLRMAVQSEALREAFADASVPLLFVKGLTLGALAYRRPLLKAGWDIDLLVAPSDLQAAAELLRAGGYRCLHPRKDNPHRLRRWHGRLKESVWRRGDVHVELHSRLADNVRLIPSIDAASPARMVDVADGIALPTLQLDELFAYLCVHGASSAWFRLKWVTDLAGLLAPLQPAAIERLYLRSQELGAGRAAPQALLLADSIYGTLGGTSLRPGLETDRASRWLAAAALRQLADAREPTATLLGTRRIHLTQLLLLPGPGFKLSEIARQARNVLLGAR